MEEEQRIKEGFDAGIDAAIKAAKGEDIPDSQLKAGMFLSRLWMQHQREKGIGVRYAFQKAYQMAKDFLQNPEDRIAYIKQSNPVIEPPHIKLLPRPVAKIAKK